MRPIDQPAELKEYYQDTEVVADYIRKRTAQPLNGAMHVRQVQFLDEVIAARAPRAVLELAPGPARLTAEIRPVPFGIAADFSPGMLQTARRRTEQAGRRWSFMRADAFSLPLRDAQLDLAFTLRFVRHFAAADRHRLYQEIRRVLRPGGALVIDAQNRLVRGRDHVTRHAVFDELYTADELRQELEREGFRVLRMEGIIRHHALQRSLNRLRALGLGAVARQMIDAVERLPSANPSTWMVLSERT